MLSIDSYRCKKFLSKKKTGYGCPCLLLFYNIYYFAIFYKVFVLKFRILSKHFDCHLFQIHIHIFLRFEYSNIKFLWKYSPIKKYYYGARLPIIDCTRINIIIFNNENFCLFKCTLKCRLSKYKLLKLM